ncbi:MAG: M23 family metallopeptidase [Pseudomonadota bacterium]|nr:M23 family metallopeptidase [Pseudomonadota bacterium]
MRSLFTLIVILLLAAAVFFVLKDGKVPMPTLPDAPTAEQPAEPADDPVQPEEEPAPDDPADEPDEDVLTDANGKVFSYYPAGDLINGSAPPSILVDDMIYDEHIVFPAEGPVFFNSQVYGHGGGKASVNGKGSDQCNAENYSYPWRDNFCEKRGKDQYFCEAGGHTGVDVRPATCKKAVHWVVAPEAGEIYDIGSYGVRLMSDDGTWYQFLHMDMNSLAVVEGQDVVAGQRIGKISNVFFDSNGDPVPTTIHVHIDMKEAYAPTNGDPAFIDRVNPYMTFVAAYERKLRGE